jgi:nucleotide-binding universal stress UspA family protein
MTHSTQSQAHAATDTSPPVRLHAVVGYDGTPPASRALDAAVRLLRGREGNIEVIYVAHVPGLDMLSADAIVEARAGFDETEKELRGSAAGGSTVTPPAIRGTGDAPPPPLAVLAHAYPPL